jgi:MerR family transcriptional regulator, thiopeptide resistance regulator
MWHYAASENTGGTSIVLTISALAKRAGLSRSALLYYDRLGLLRPVKRSRARYRLYSPDEVDRLEQICFFRQMGIPLKEMKKMLDPSEGNAPEQILRRRLRFLGREIANLHRQQRCILELLKQKQLQQGVEMINKERWVEIMRAAGLGDQDMHNWHVQFEKMEPEAHQEFLESLGIQTAEIKKIREWSRKA